MKNINHIIAAYTDIDQDSKDFFLKTMTTWDKLCPKIIEIISAYITMDQDSKDFAHVAMTTWAELNPDISTLNTISDKPTQKLFLVPKVGNQ